MKPNSNNFIDIQGFLDSFYEKSLNGFSKISPSVSEMSINFLNKYRDKDTAAKMLIKNHIMKCALSGFLTGLGGLVILPIALPINIISVLYMQVRMIACLAHISGLELHNEKTKAFVYACLAGVPLSAVLKGTGIKFGVKIAQSVINKLPAKLIAKMNQKVGFKLLSKVGIKTAANFSKFIPGIGGLIGGAIDYFETKIISDRAYKMFMQDNNDDKKDSDESFIDVDDYTIK